MRQKYLKVFIKHHFKANLKNIYQYLESYCGDVRNQVTEKAT